MQCNVTVNALHLFLMVQWVDCGSPGHILFIFLCDFAQLKYNEICCQLAEYTFTMAILLPRSKAIRAHNAMRLSGNI